MSAEPLVLFDIADGVARITLNRPQRHNSLVPELVAALNSALSEVRKHDLAALVLAGAGKSFSTGGDVAAFHAVPRGKRRAYAEVLVGGLHEAILTLLDMPMPVITRVHGPVTGGSLGLVLAADLVAIASSTFIAPYYVDVGFSPDGGWTALLPERIGAARAREIQILNRHISAGAAVAYGIATEATAARQLDEVIESWIATLHGKVRGSVRATRELLAPPERRTEVEGRLRRELDRFLDQIETEEADAGMAKFLAVA
ncbi:MAG: enoyl-CoA hydratase/isomerase family protein [Xanthobacteraceae bacterium]|nr:enoyl-CoA hydratase/isomerase family protein [Xanthobacteraceae bacterium]MBX3547948.1 enoyl-CoA hydratase/isomerase family protein [Xanthobacteraceae bacterium]MCW5676975.1 enoyl-CoA hydratase/isomerase family protein [Xanthobacteraceae bacterium]